VSPATDLIADFLGGFVAAEGTFVCSPVRSGQGQRFTFAVGLGATDSSTCLLFEEYFGCGNVYTYHRRKPHYDDECTFTVQSLRDHLDVTVPFMDSHLPVSYKRVQYLEWRRVLLDYCNHASRPARARSRRSRP
jgi:LAGLIDADG endonuclease